MNILSIGGADPSSGAGVQGDIRVASALDVNCFSVITAITSQNSTRFSDAESVSPRMIERQIDSIFSDFKVDAITIGMVYDSSTIQIIHSKLRGRKIPIILDPVIESTTGGTLLKKTALEQFRKLLIPLCFVITPNVSEAQVLSGIKITKESDLARAAKKLSSLGAKNVVITGHKFVKNKISDFVYEDGKSSTIAGNRINEETHGSGCTFAFALSYAIASKNTLSDAVKFAKCFTYQSIKNAQSLGHGVKITNLKKDKIKTDLSSAIKEFENLRDAHGLIPECQTNFVYSKQNPRSVSDVLGISGRIVKARKKANRCRKFGVRRIKTRCDCSSYNAKKVPQDSICIKHKI